uniref:Uncharacterized protein n=1 Tax=Arundo donax TaxID=35708 RepID=A0A0A8Y7I9_ARUDO
MFAMEFNMLFSLKETMIYTSVKCKRQSYKNWPCVF